MNSDAFSIGKIDLPVLKKPAGIQPANILALQSIYVAAQLEELKMFSVVDRLVELAQSGRLPIGNSTAGQMLNDYWQKRGSRMTAVERRNIYFRAFGVESGGSSSATPNREFNDLWGRFVAAVSAFVRQLGRAKPSASAQLRVKNRQQIWPRICRCTATVSVTLRLASCKRSSTI
jgi:hypothetical protein